MANKTRAEMETVIVRAADEQTWSVFSEDPRVIRVLERRHGGGRKHGSGFRWTLGASCVSFPAPRRLSEQQRKVATERLAAMRAKKSGATGQDI
jgi:hypothetical protein